MTAPINRPFDERELATLLDYLATQHGQPCPHNDAIAAALGRRSGHGLYRLLAEMERRKQIQCRYSPTERMIAAGDNSWRTLRTQHRGTGTPGGINSAERVRVSTNAWQDRRRALPPVRDDEAEALKAAFLAARSVTVCPPAAVLPVNNGSGFGP